MSSPITSARVPGTEVSVTSRAGCRPGDRRSCRCRKKIGHRDRRSGLVGANRCFDDRQRPDLALTRIRHLSAERRGPERFQRTVVTARPDRRVCRRRPRRERQEHRPPAFAVPDARPVRPQHALIALDPQRVFGAIRRQRPVVVQMQVARQLHERLGRGSVAVQAPGRAGAARDDAHRLEVEDPAQAVEVVHGHVEQLRVVDRPRDRRASRSGVVDRRSSPA